MTPAQQIRKEVFNLPLLGGDVELIRRCTSGSNGSYWFLLAGYLSAWEIGEGEEVLGHKQTNAGRAAANEWIRSARDEI